MMKSAVPLGAIRFKGFISIFSFYIYIYKLGFRWATRRSAAKRGRGRGGRARAAGGRGVVLARRLRERR